MEFTNEELTVVIDGLAQLPIHRGYNVFQKVMAEYQRRNAAQTPPPKVNPDPVTKD